eukprot:3453730-Prymnesium_polylepis.1
MVRRKAVFERYAALRCLWHGVRVVESCSDPSAPVSRNWFECRRVDHGVLGGRWKGAAGTCAWAARGRSSGATAGRGAVRARAGRGRRAAGR